MGKQLLISNLKAVKQAAKQAPELLRTGLGYLSSRASFADNPFVLGSLADCTPRPLEGGGGRYPCTVVTPPDGHYMTTFFDVDPFSPSGRFLLVTQVPFINRIPIPGDVARVCVIDLLQGTCRSVYETTGWGAQLGANVQWGASDDVVFCNDIIEGKAVGVRVNLISGRADALHGPVYGLTPDARYSYSPNIRLVNAILPGYGVPEHVLGGERQKEQASKSEGIWKTDLATGRCELFMSVDAIVSQLPEQSTVAGGRYYVFNVKVNRQNTRLFAILFSRAVPLRAGKPVQLVTMALDGSDVQLAMPDRLWRLGGHHPSWAPDGEHILMNLRPEGGQMAFVQFRYDGTELSAVAPGHKGSGHPSFSPNSDYLMTDSYIFEGFMDRDGKVPLRLINLRENSEEVICPVYTNRVEGFRRIDPHPVWEKTGRRVAFNACVGGKRQVVVADMGMLGASG